MQYSNLRYFFLFLGILFIILFISTFSVEFIKQYFLKVGILWFINNLIFTILVVLLVKWEINNPPK